MFSTLFFNDTADTEIYTLSLHDALPIFEGEVPIGAVLSLTGAAASYGESQQRGLELAAAQLADEGGVTYDLRIEDRKSTRLNSSHANISYAVFCLKKKEQHTSELHSRQY